MFLLPDSDGMWGATIFLLLRNRIREIVDELQNRLQRGFTPKVAPLYCALILYECILEALDKKIPIHVAFRDAKAVFNVVVIIFLIW
jgi:hypothetical protein